MRILIVEDEPGIQKMIKIFMKPYGRCVTAGNGAEAVVKFQTALNQQQAFDLILLDIMMPVMDGLKALEKIRTIEREKNIKEVNGVKVIMLTATDDTPSVLTSFRHRCDSYLVKPFEDTELIAELRKLKLIA